MNCIFVPTSSLKGRKAGRVVVESSSLSLANSSQFAIRVYGQMVEPTLFFLPRSSPIKQVRHE